MVVGAVITGLLLCALGHDLLVRFCMCLCIDYLIDIEFVGAVITDLLLCLIEQ